MINESFLVMPSALVGTILLTLRGRGISFAELVSRIEWLRCEIYDRGSLVVDFGREPIESVVERTVPLNKIFV